MLSLFLEKLTSRTRLTAAECQAVRDLVGKPELLKARSPIVLIGDMATSTTLVLDGFCGRVEAPRDDRRQITAIYVQGDMPDLYSAYQPEANASMEALTVASILRISHAAIRDVVRLYPAVGEAFTRYLVADAAITTEWLTNVGSREARSSLAHLFCEMAVRLARVETNEFTFFFPLSQQQLGEACGLSAVHINRSVMALRRGKLMQIDKGMVRVLDWAGLQVEAGFDGRYLMPSVPKRYAN